MKKQNKNTKYEKEMRELARAWVLLFLEQKGYIHLLGKSKTNTTSSVDINPLKEFYLNYEKREKKANQ